VGDYHISCSVVSSHTVGRRVLLCKHLQNINQCSQSVPYVQAIERFNKRFLKLKTILCDGILQIVEQEDNHQCYFFPIYIYLEREREREVMIKVFKDDLDRLRYLCFNERPPSVLNN
jgi:hypothetical protein